MNSSVYSADRGTHLRILVAALIASIGMVVFALALHVGKDEAYSAAVRVHPSHKVEASGQSVPASRI